MGGETDRNGSKKTFCTVFGSSHENGKFGMERDRGNILGVSFQGLHTRFVLVVPHLHQSIYDDIIHTNNDIIEK